MPKPQRHSGPRAAAGAVYLGRQAEDAYRVLRREIEQGVHAAGTRLPPERALTARFGVSRMTLRQAIARLALEGLVEARQGSGTFVCAGGVGADRLNMLSIMYTLDAVTLAQVQEYALSRGCLTSVFLQTRTQWQPEAERRFLQQVKEQGHRALLAFCSPREPHNDELLRELAHSGVRVLHIEHYRLELPEQSYLLPDFRCAGHMAAVALMLARYDALRLVTYKSSQAPYERLQIEGFGAALTEHRGGFDPERCLLEGITCGATETAVDYRAKLVAFVRRLPPNCGLAVHTAGHAARLAEAAREAGLRVPDDLGIIGIDVAGGGEAQGVDSLSFRRPELLRRAVDAVLAPDWPGLRELVAPTRMVAGTVRENGSSCGAAWQSVVGDP